MLLNVFLWWLVFERGSEENIIKYFMKGLKWYILIIIFLRGVVIVCNKICLCGFCICMVDYSLVCGRDGKIYSNSCNVKCL